MTMNSKTKEILAHRLLGAVDLAIDFATLGEYGIEPLPAAGGPRRERPGRKTGWEALPTGRARGSCPGEHPAGRVPGPAHRVPGLMGRVSGPPDRRRRDRARRRQHNRGRGRRAA